MDDTSPKAPQEPTPWQYKPGESVGPEVSPASQSAAPQPAPVVSPASVSQSDIMNDAVPQPSGGVSWSASEYVAHQKSGGWYILLTIVALILAAVVYMLTKDIFSTAVVVVAAIVFGAYGARKPRVLQYALDTHGITIGHKTYHFGQFRSFSIAEEGAFSSINLMPLKRFMPIITVYFDPKDEDKITGLLAGYLPLETGKKDAVDALLHKIRF